MTANTHQNYQGCGRPEKLKNCRNLVETKETQKLNTVWDPGLDFGTGKRH